MKITETHVRLALVAWLVAATAAHLWQFAPLLPHILRALGVSS
jgi:hypothetical protein